jgi:hypothetical protein
MKCPKNLPSAAKSAREYHHAQTVGRQEEEEIVVYLPVCRKTSGVK